MDTALLCLACLGFGDPMLTPELGIHADVLGATTFSVRSEAPADASNPDGLHLQEARLALSGRPLGFLGAYASLSATEVGLSHAEVYADLEPTPGLVIRAGRWLQALGGLGGRHVERRAFVDLPLHTERFIGRDGLYDVGLGVAWQLPWETMPVRLMAGVFSGASGLSFQPVAKVGEGGGVFERLLTVVNLQIDPGALFGERLVLGFTFASGQNGTGPGNRTDLVGADLGGRFALAPEAVLEADIEFLMRRYGVPNALLVEGGLSADVALNWRGILAALRVDLLGLPKPPERDTLQWRVSVAGGYALGERLWARLQYAARNDNPAGATGHELVLQAVVGFGGRVDRRSSAASERPHRASDRARPSPVEALKGRSALAVGAPESNDPDDWRVTAGLTLRAAEEAADSERYPHAVFLSQQAAYMSLNALALRQGLMTQSPSRGATAAAERLAAAGIEVPPRVLSDARALDRHFAGSRFPSALGGGPGRYYDRQTAQSALARARSLRRWVDARWRAPDAAPRSPAGGLPAKPTD